MTTVATSSGRLQVDRRNGLVHARGVPYATARRFQAPRPVDDRGTVWDATHRGPRSPQNPSRLDGVTGPIGTELTVSEDCLVVSVVAPENAADAPVMVWLHGGAYMSGAGEARKYDADSLAQEGLIVVNVTYRLGIFGYLPPSWAQTDNLGLLDQIEALRWVQMNIGAFGGDPGNVTVFGQSAGGHSVVALLRSWPTTEGLLNHAIVQSAPLGLGEDRTRMAATLREVVDQHVHEQSSVRDILRAEHIVVETARQFGLAGSLPFAPIPGVGALPADDALPMSSVPEQVDLLIGFAANDAVPFLAASLTDGTPAGLVQAGRHVDRVVARRVTEQVFGPAPLRALWDSADGASATYRIEWSPPDAPFGACHCIELPLLFSNDWADAPMLAGDSIPTLLAAELRRSWAAFARHGVRGLPGTNLRFTSAAAPSESPRTPARPQDR
jgi:para-nitrobenzyl esterase